MYGWCEKCGAIALEGLCSKHGETKPVPSINAVDLHPLPKFEKEFLNKHLNGLKLGDGLFLIYGDRIRRRKVVILDKPIAEVKLKKDGFHVNPFIKGKITGMKKESVCEANEERIERLTKIAKTFSQWEIESNGNSIVSFSGGRDSLVLSHLLKDFGLKNVFIDTTIEFPETYKFIKKLQKAGWDIDTVRAKVSFFELCKIKGYPSYDNRWCCKTQKFGPFSSYINEKHGGKRVLVFSGVRRCESIARLEQPLKKEHKYIQNQDTIQPLLDWLSLDIWVYIWKNNLPVNEIYNYFDRSGCWLCPFGLRYRLFLLQSSHPALGKLLQKIRNNN